MASIEKKYSDFQKKDCDEFTFDDEGAIAKELCPTCVPNPNFKLEGNWWEIDNAYLNEAECEYHVLVFENDKAVKDKKLSKNKSIIEVGIERILVDLDKPLNNEIKDQLRPATYIKDSHRGLRTGQTGMAKLVAIPAFNFDKIEPNDSENAEEDQNDFSSGGEIVLETNHLWRKLTQLGYSLYTYGMFYRYLQGDEFVIRQEQDEVARINYELTRTKLKTFKEELNDALSESGFARLNRTGFFKSKRAEKIKIVFKSNGKPFELKAIYALPDTGCSKYEKLKIKRGNDLRKSSMGVIYNFLQNFNKVINDITAKETKPWLDFTLENFYPKYIVDYGNVIDLEEKRNGLECLLENQLGIGNGKVIDSLTKEILSAFASAEKELAKQACRDLAKKVPGSPTTLANQKSPIEQRTEQMKARYAKEFENKAYEQLIEALKTENITEDLQAFIALTSPTEQKNNSENDQVNPEDTEEYKSQLTKFLSDNVPQLTGGNLKVGSTGPEVLKLQTIVKKFFIDDGDQDFANFVQLNSEFNKDFKNLFESYQSMNNLFNSRNETDGIYGPQAQNHIKNVVEQSFVFSPVVIDPPTPQIEQQEDLNDPAPIEPTRENVFDLIKNQIGTAAPNKFDVQVSYNYTHKGTKKRTKSDFVRSIKAMEDLESAKKAYAEQKFNDLEAGSFRDQIANSPHFQEAKDAAREVIKNPSNTFIQGFKDAIEKRNERGEGYSIVEVISIFGVCGMSKTAGKALQCLAGGVSFDKFIGMLIDKAFDFMEFNTLDLFLNGLPSNFREDLNKAIEKEFGSITLNDIIKLKTAEDGNQKLSDVTKTKEIAEKLLEISRKIVNNKYPTKEEIDFISNTILDFSYGGTTDTFTKEEYNQFLTYDFAISQGPRELEEDAKKKALKILKQKIRAYKREKNKAAFDRVIDNIKNIPETIIVDENEQDAYLKSIKSFKSTNLGTKVDVVFDLIFDFIIDEIKDKFNIDELYKMLMNYPIVSFVADLIEKHKGECPIAPVIYPPPNDFMKSLSVDFCDPTFSLTMPKISIPSINLRFQIESGFSEIFREKLIQLVSNIAIKLLKKLMFTLEGSLCKAFEAVGGFSADALRSSFNNKKASFLEALNEAFCNDGQNPDTAKSKAQELADALFSPLMFNSGADYSGSGAKISNIISSVASTNEFLSAMTAREGEEDYQFNARISQAINTLAPEVEGLLGDPNQVAYFFRNLGSYLTPDDKDRIRDLLAAGIPNLPISPALCLTNDQLDEWNKFREGLLGDPRSVDDLNRATEDALSDIMDDVGNLQKDGPFLGSITNEVLADVCNKNNLLNDVSQNDFDQKQQDELVDNFFNNISRSLQSGFFGRGGLLSEAMADTEGRIEFWRSFQKFFRPNYTNSDSERQIKYGDKRRIGKWIMDNTDQGEAVGIYPETVAIKQRKQILDEEDSGGKLYQINSETNRVVYRYNDSDEYKLNVRANNLNSSKTNFNYRINLLETIDENTDVILDFITPISTTKEEKDYMDSIGFSLLTNNKEDVRKELFNKIVQKKIGLNLNFNDLYSQTFESFNKKLVEGLLTVDGDIPVGYKFGYTSDTLSKDSFKYTPSDVEGELGTFGDKRIIALDPKIYGGTYNNPPFYVEPRQFTGWFELGKKAFSTEEGCEPMKQPLFDMSDIKQRVKMLSNSLRNDPRLTKDPDCVSDKPFHALLDSKNKSKLDGVIRTTLRTYLGEYFIKGFGLFSSLQIRSDNFDNSMMLYITKMLKKEMSDLGVFTSNRKIRIVRERYWYSFLEQCVEAYQRMIDVDGIEPSEEIMNALNKIQMGMDKYISIDRSIKKRMKNNFPEGGIQKPSANYNPLQVLNEGMVNFCLQAIAFRLTPEDEREDFFNGEMFTDLTKGDIRRSSIKKIKFFQKIYFIKLFEKEATLIMSELIKNEFNRLSDNVVNGLTDKPHYYDLSRSIFGMSPIFNGSTSRIGTSLFYLDKQRGVIDTGTVPEVQSSNATCPITPTEEPQFLIESYVKMEDKVGVELPTFIKNRDGKYTGMISLSNASAFFDQYGDQMEDKYLSDYFGNLSFTFEGSFKKLLEAGFTSGQDLNRLLELNKETLNIAQLQNARNSYIGSREFQDFNVIFDETFLKEGDKFEPKGTKGTTGVKYGLRLSLVFPNTVNVQNLTSTILAKSKIEKAYHFEDGSFVLPLVTSEVNVKDCKVEDFDPFYGQEPYDLECLINAMVENIEFKVIMEKVFNLKQASSMLAIYCMETLAPAIGRDESERTTLDTDPDSDDWDKVINKFGKNFLRREFKSIYLSTHQDGQGEDDDDDSDDFKRMKFNNPFDFLTLPSVKIPWFRKRRMKFKIYDKNGEECANPKKDLE